MTNDIKTQLKKAHKMVSKISFIIFMLFMIMTIITGFAFIVSLNDNFVPMVFISFVLAILFTMISYILFVVIDAFFTTKIRNLELMEEMNNNIKIQTRIQVQRFKNGA